MSRQRMAALRDSFPSLAGRFKPEFDPEELAAFCKSPAATSGSGNAAKFVLSVWSGAGAVQWTDPEREGDPDSAPAMEIDDWRWPWGILPFDLHRALGVWDDAHRSAFMAWAQEPWWP